MINQSFCGIWEIYLRKMSQFVIEKGNLVWFAKITYSKWWSSTTVGNQMETICDRTKKNTKSEAWATWNCENVIDPN